jgi:heat shock protein HslJ
MRKILIGLVLSASLGLVSGCAVPTPTPTSIPSEQLNKNWVLVSGTDGQGYWVKGSEGATRLTIDNGQVSGQICNSWGGDIAIEGSSMAITSLHSTEMFCTEPEGIMDRETRFLNDISLVTTIQIVDGFLLLSGGGVDLKFMSYYS